MTTKVADRYADIARRMKYLGLDRDEPKAANQPFIFPESAIYELVPSDDLKRLSETFVVIGAGPG